MPTEVRHCLSQGGSAERWHGGQKSFLHMTVTCLPRGAQIDGSDDPKIAAVGHPAAAARWETPLSLPTKKVQRARIAARIGRGGEIRTEAAGGRVVLSSSAGPRSQSQGTPASLSRSASLLNRSTGQFLRSLPLPGCRTKGADPGGSSSIDRLTASAEGRSRGVLSASVSASGSVRSDRW